MNNEIVPLEKSDQEFSQKYHLASYDLYEGINLAFMSLTGRKQTDTHEPLKHILEINYCHKGRIGWKMANRNSIYLGEHDFSLHTMEYCSASIITLPNEYYEGIKIYIDLNILSEKMEIFQFSLAMKKLTLSFQHSIISQKNFNLHTGE